jgi:hypothetical protein
MRLPLSQIAPLAAIKYAYFAGKCTFIYAHSITDRRGLVKGNLIRSNYLPKNSFILLSTMLYYCRIHIVLFALSDKELIL